MDKISHDLWSGYNAIGLFIHNSEFYWVMNYKENFALNPDVNMRIGLTDGSLNLEQYEEIKRSYRGGVYQITTDNFIDYVTHDDVTLFTFEQMKELMFYNFDESLLTTLRRKLKPSEPDFPQREELNSNEFLKWNEMASRFPLFYINFDEKQFFHLDRDRFHESQAYPDWDAANKNFLSLIPDEQKYWIKDDFNYETICFFPKDLS
ncbi:hypothetical protein OE749_08410 [Aestuariibacter sp. AA17]|uniref:Uncharacterized protein n=2 Tax=Fluctibacter corallii TaxID=2984329 RepID=A0ABT3A8S8_9ALTE|nr:hypothetical protein [Aestuariibacter sp. AA17]